MHHLNDTTSVDAKCNCQAQTNQREDNFVGNGYLLSVGQFLSGRRWAVDDTIVRQVVEQRGQHDESSAQERVQRNDDRAQLVDTRDTTSGHGEVIDFSPSRS